MRLLGLEPFWLTPGSRIAEALRLNVDLARGFRDSESCVKAAMLRLGALHRRGFQESGPRGVRVERRRTANSGLA